MLGPEGGEEKGTDTDSRLLWHVLYPPPLPGAHTGSGRFLSPGRSPSVGGREEDADTRWKTLERCICRALYTVKCWEREGLVLGSLPAPLQAQSFIFHLSLEVKYLAVLMGYWIFSLWPHHSERAALLR